MLVNWDAVNPVKCWLYWDWRKWNNFISFFVIAKEWKPRYGYKRANDDTKDWLLEVPANAGDIFIIYPLGNKHTLIWKFHEVDDFYYHTQKGRHPFQTSSFELIKKDLYYNHFFFQIHMKINLPRKLKPRRKGLPRMNISDSGTLHETRRLLVSLLKFCCKCCDA